MATEVPTSAEFYVRGAIMKALVSTAQQLNELQEIIDSDSAPAMWKGSAEGLMSYLQQWRREAKEEFRKLPDSLRPNENLLDG